MTKQKYIIGTRGSQLALYQANRVKDVLSSKYPELTFELKIIKTKGDKILDVALSKIGDKGLFTKELEVAMLNDEADLVVHSLKDMPTELPEGFQLTAVLERGNYKDALVSKNGKKLSDLTVDDVIATSSLRRKSGLLKINPNFQIVDIRGNVNTRLQKMEDGHCDAMIMAAAGLERLGLEHHITEILEPEVMIPAVSQGVIGIETRIDTPEINELVASINDEVTWQTILGERAYMNALNGGCQVPVGCYSKVNNNEITLIGFVSSTDAKQYLTTSVSGDIKNAEQLGIELADKLIAEGATLILDEIRG